MSPRCADPVKLQMNRVNTWTFVQARATGILGPGTAGTGRWFGCGNDQSRLLMFDAMVAMRSQDRKRVRRWTESAAS
jgi:hypothetical protein